jgi:hypothetical protein
VIKPMVPYKNTDTIKSDGSVCEGSSVLMTGHTLIQAESIHRALAMAKTCLILNINGSLEVASLVDISKR